MAVSFRKTLKWRVATIPGEDVVNGRWVTECGRYVARFTGLTETGAPIWHLYWTEKGGRWQLKQKALTSCQRQAEYIEERRKKEG